MKPFIPALCVLLFSCDTPKPGPPASGSRGNVPLEIDGVKLFVPLASAAGRPWHPRPWPHGLHIGSGGWGEFNPRLGPLELAEKLPPGQAYRAASSGQAAPSHRPAPFFRFVVTFEFPERPRRTSWGGSARDWSSAPFKFDQLKLSYRSPSEDVEGPYVKLLQGVSYVDGADVGSGWRELRRQFAGKPISIRFDASDWRTRGGPLPRRLAASFGEPFWAHYMPLDSSRWEAEFETQSLPLDEWRARYETAEELFAWLRTPAARRQAERRFNWWSNPSSRPAK